MREDMREIENYEVNVVVPEKIKKIQKITIKLNFFILFGIIFPFNKIF